jgi:ribosomal protein S18 acetylase RimI-like enzyme
MSDARMPSLQLKISRQEFEQLPRHPAYKYEYLGSIAYLSPWPRYYHAQLDLPSYAPETNSVGQATLRPVRLEDVEAMTPIFARAFTRLQPFGSLLEPQLLLESEQALRMAFAGVDGPIAVPASFVALDQGNILGAILITLLPGGSPTEWDSYHWNEPAPEDLGSSQQGQPHLTWIFVDSLAQGTGIGSQLLHASVRVLRDQGYKKLWTTFMMGNDSSSLWHWRNGFELLPHFTSKRKSKRT